jgi:hypothetical protein
MVKRNNTLPVVAIVVALLGGAGALGYLVFSGPRRRDEQPAVARAREPPAASRPIEPAAGDRPDEPLALRSPAPAPGPDALAAGVRSATGELVPENMVGEEVTDVSRCDQICGGRCLTAANGVLHCPRVCLRDEDCDAESLCVSLGRNSRCLRSECSAVGADAECGPGKTCLYSGRLEGGIYRCVATGARKAGEFCAFGSASGEQQRCGSGQTCLNGLCMPASCQRKEDCPKGAICAPMAGGPEQKQCAPFCASDEDCPPKQICNHMPSGATVCGPLSSKAECLRAGCPTGQTCMLDQPAVWDLQATCRPSCSAPSAAGGAGAAGCPAGQHCALERSTPGTGGCVVDCKPGPGGCAQGQACVQDATGAFGCRLTGPSLAQRSAGLEKSP